MHLPVANHPLWSWVRALARVRFVAAAGIVAGLAACGGGTKSIEPFVPVRTVSFGDESAWIAADGRRYTVGDFTEGALDCTKNALWIQQMSTNLAVPMQPCPGTSTSAPSLMRSEPLARVSNLTAQVDSFLQSGSFGEKDLVTMSVGMHDILDQYANASSTDEATLTARLQAAGRAFGAQVNRVALLGAPVLVLTVHDLGITPFGNAQERATPGRRDMLRRLTSAFNIAMRLELINDGRLIGLVDTFDLVNAMARFPQAYTVTNITDPSCAVAMPDCTSATLLQADGNAVPYSFYLWADDLRFGPAVHSRLGVLAESRARNNPF